VKSNSPLTSRWTIGNDILSLIPSVNGDDRNPPSLLYGLIEVLPY
jgi:hypothetical protein